MFYFRSEINSRTVKQIINKLFSNRFRFNKKPYIQSSTPMDKNQEEPKTKIERKPQLHEDSFENPRLSDFQNMSPDSQQQAQFFT